MANGRCRLHGGKSTGARTPKGLASLARAHTKHGNHGAAARVEHRAQRTLIIRHLVMGAAMRLRPYLPRELRERIAAGMPELAAPPLHVWKPVAKNQDMAPCAVVPGAAARDARGRFAARARPALWGRKAEREAARAERAMLAPWRAGIKRARLIKRLLMSQKRAARDAARGEGARAAAARRAGADGGAGVDGGKAQAAPVEKHGHGLLQRGAVAAGGAVRMGKHDKDPMPLGRLPGAGLGARAAGIAAATQAGGAGTAARMGKHDKDPMPMERLPGTCPGGGAVGVAGSAGGLGSVGGLRPGEALGQKGRVEELGRGPLQRGAVGVAGSARMGKHDKDPTPMERLPGAGLGARAAGIAAATEAGGAGTARADAILAALPNRAARRRWKSLQRRKHRGTGAIG
jgi:hypothetical protein